MAINLGIRNIVSLIFWCLEDLLRQSFISGLKRRELKIENYSTQPFYRIALNNRPRYPWRIQRLFHRDTR